ncbi:cysteine hydrolase [Brachybacterium endophyticum]|uniref:Cysteine hydrolase n=1 Tax=Brachybacterium endophyticum TaxID=2182385 RepID=A0A2U2RKN9_9MICO|nr:isochorismatase family cysteine hydrolase [Brachybacterium endophyticum]PWH06430.1 cysteine hydrolase [Brachybacterium endophyticum]
MTAPATDALLLIDLQEAFLTAPGLAGSREEVVEATTSLIDAAKDADVPVLLVTTEHSRDRSTWTLTMFDDDQGFLFHGDAGTEVIHEIDTTGMTRLEKTRDSAFFATDLLLRLRNLAVERVVVAGVSTHACITQTARDAFANNIRVSIVTDAVADERPEHKDAVLELLEDDRQAELVDVREMLGRWRA